MISEWCKDWVCLLSVKDYAVLILFQICSYCYYFSSARVWSAVCERKGNAEPVSGLLCGAEMDDAVC